MALVFLRLYLTSKASQYSLNLSSDMARFPIANSVDPATSHSLGIMCPTMPARP